MTKIVAISDTHTFHRQLTVPDGDIFVHAGDFLLSGNVEELSVLYDFNRWLGELPHKHKFVTCGNHDRMLETHPSLTRPMITNADLVLDDVREVEGLRFYFSPWTPRFPEGSDYWKFMKERGEMRQVWNDIPNNIDVLVTHGPPAGVLDTVSEKAVGDMSLLDAVLRIRPTYHIFGHVHEGRGQVQNQWTEFVNATQVDAVYRPVYQPIVLEV